VCINNCSIKKKKIREEGGHCRGGKLQNSEEYSKGFLLNTYMWDLLPPYPSAPS
jgi:hypothetical protein